LRIDENQISRYANVSREEAESILAHLIKIHAVHIDVEVNCPKCFMPHLIENMEKELVCLECGDKFYPKENKRFIHYYYMLNDKSKIFNSYREKSRLRNPLFKIAKSDLRGELSMTKKVKIFLSYSHKDEKYKEELDKHFSMLKRSEKVETWNDREIKAGSKFDEDIKNHLDQDDIIILLISPDFLASDYCYNIEMQRAIERANNNECEVIPIIVRPCLWTETPIKDFLALPKDGTPISRYDDSDEAYLEIVSSVNKMIKSFGQL